MTVRRAWVTAALLGCAALAFQQQTPQKAKIQQDLNDAIVGAWVYDDIDQGYALAKKSNKPILVVFR